MTKHLPNLTDANKPVAWIETFKHSGGESNWEHRLVWDDPVVTLPALKGKTPLFAKSPPSHDINPEQAGLVGIMSSGTFVHWTNDNVPKAGTKFYTHPPAQPIIESDALQDLASFIGVGGFNGATTDQIIGRIKDEFVRLYAIKAIAPDSSIPNDPIAKITAFDEYGPMFGWFKHWAALHVGTLLYTTPQSEQIKEVVVNADYRAMWQQVTKSNQALNTRIEELYDQLKAQASKPVHANHVLYQTSDKDKPDQICDVNGEVVLSLCKVCGKGEADLLDTPCIPNAERAALTIDADLLLTQEQAGTK